MASAQALQYFMVEVTLKDMDKAIVIWPQRNTKICTMLLESLFVCIHEQNNIQYTKMLPPVQRQNYTDPMT